MAAPGTTRFFINALETAVNRYLQMDPDGAAKLAALTDKIIHIKITTPALDFWLLIENHTIRFLQQPSDEIRVEPDVSIAVASPLVLLKFAHGDDDAEREIHISGNMHTARALQQVLRTLDVDWEEQVAQLIGDIPAHQLGNIARSGRHWGQQVLEKFRLDTSEYLLYEAEVLPTRHTIERFLQQVDTLRDDTARLEARIQRLQRRCSNSSSKRSPGTE